MKNPELTICMPLYNGEKYLDESVVSVLSQTYGDFKFLIYDDGSTDESVEKVKSFNDKRITIIEGKENRGGIYARTQLINAIDTKYCMWIDDDDRYCRNDAVEDAMQLIKSSDYDMVNFAKTIEINSEGKRFLYHYGLYKDFSYCGDRLFEKFYPTDNHYIFNSKIFKSELIKKSVPGNDVLSKRFVADDMFFSAIWFYCAKKYLHVVDVVQPIYEYKNSIGIWGGSQHDVSPKRIGDLCVLQYSVLVSLYNRVCAIKTPTDAEVNSLISGVNLPMICRMIANARKVYGNEYADNLVNIWHSAFCKDGVHLLNGVELFAMPAYIKMLEAIMK